MWFKEGHPPEIQKQSLGDFSWKWLLLNFDNLGEDTSIYL